MTLYCTEELDWIGLRFKIPGVLLLLLAGGSLVYRGQRAWLLFHCRATSGRGP